MRGTIRKHCAKAMDTIKFRQHNGPSEEQNQGSRAWLEARRRSFTSWAIPTKWPRFDGAALFAWEMKAASVHTDSWTPFTSHTNKQPLPNQCVQQCYRLPELTALLCLSDVELSWFSYYFPVDLNVQLSNPASFVPPVPCSRRIVLSEISTVTVFHLILWLIWRKKKAIKHHAQL